MLQERIIRVYVEINMLLSVFIHQELSHASDTAPASLILLGVLLFRILPLEAEALSATIIRAKLAVFGLGLHYILTAGASHILIGFLLWLVSCALQKVDWILAVVLMLEAKNVDHLGEVNLLRPGVSVLLNEAADLIS